MYVAEPLPLRERDRWRLEALTRASTVPAGLATKVWIVLLAADGVATPITPMRPAPRGRRCSSGVPRYAQSGADGLHDDPRPGRTAVIDEVAVLARRWRARETASPSRCDALVDVADGGCGGVALSSHGCPDRRVFRGGGRVDPAAFWSGKATRSHQSYDHNGDDKNTSRHFGTALEAAELLPRNTGEARLIPRGTPGEMVELLDWDDFVTYLDELRAARRMGSVQTTVQR